MGATLWLFGTVCVDVQVWSDFFIFYIFLGKQGFQRLFSSPMNKKGYLKLSQSYFRLWKAFQPSNLTLKYFFEKQERQTFTQKIYFHVFLTADINFWLFQVLNVNYQVLTVKVFNFLWAARSQLSDFSTSRKLSNVICQDSKFYASNQVSTVRFFIFL